MAFTTWWQAFCTSITFNFHAIPAQSFFHLLHNCSPPPNFYFPFNGSFLAMLLSFPEFEVDGIAFRADIGHHGYISVKAFTSAGNAFFFGFGIIHGCYHQCQQGYNRLAGLLAVYCCKESFQHSVPGGLSSMRWRSASSEEMLRVMPEAAL